MDNSTSRSLIARTLGHYELVQQVGCGVMSTVYEARDARLGRTVALKVLDAPAYLSPSESQEMIERMNREARALAGLNHPNVVSIYDVGAQDNQHYIVMEFLDGVTLRARLDQGALTLEETADIITQVAAGLDAIHRHGVLHRDIKASNIMLLFNGQVKMVDFGIARAATDVTVTQVGTMIGSPAYMAPELFEGRKAGFSSDLWSLGVLLYEMVARRLPFQSEGVSRTLYRILYTEPDPLLDVSPEIQAVLRRALQKDPEARYPTARALTEAFDTAVASSSPIDTEPTMPSAQTTTPEPLALFEMTAPPEPVRWMAVPFPLPAEERQEEATHPAFETMRPQKRRLVPVLSAMALLLTGLAAASFLLKPKAPASKASSGLAAPTVAQKPRVTPTSIPTEKPEVEATPTARPQSDHFTATHKASVKTPQTPRRRVASGNSASEVASLSRNRQQQEARWRKQSAQTRETAAPETNRTTHSQPVTKQPEVNPRDDKAESLTLATQRAEIEGPTADSEALEELSSQFDSWIGTINMGDIASLMRLYAPRLTRYYLWQNMSRTAVRAEILRQVERDDVIDIRAGEPTITLNDEGQQAIMRFRKEYAIPGTRGRRWGAVTSELQWQRTENGWKIVSERDLRVLSR